MKHPSTAIISAIILVLFLLPYIWKLKEIGLLVVLCIGLFLVVYDFFVNSRQKVKREAQHASYESEST
jgi:cell division protein FtsW (lipid II flippase)|tara:strand:- start:274 stop:477 length:204 start_codon:yes stop_codon:yes gene_type:complete